MEGADRMNCVQCGTQVPLEQNFCGQCGCDIRIIKKRKVLLETDPELKAMNRNYIHYGVLRLIAGLLAALSIFLIYNALESHIPDELGILGMILLLPSVIALSIGCILRGCQKRKMQRKLENRCVQIRTNGGLY